MGKITIKIDQNNQVFERDFADNVCWKIFFDYFGFDTKRREQPQTPALPQSQAPPKKRIDNIGQI